MAIHSSIVACRSLWTVQSMGSQTVRHDWVTLTQHTALRYFFPNLEPVCCSMSSSHCCFLTCIQVSQEAGKMVWYSHLFKNFPQFVVIHAVNSFSTVNEPNVFLDFPCFLDDPTNVGNLITDSSAFSKSSSYIYKFSVHILLKSRLKKFEHNMTSMCQRTEITRFLIWFLIFRFKTQVSLNSANILSVC